MTIDTQLTENCLSLAIMIASQEEYTRLESSSGVGGNLHEVARAIQRSLISLERLRSQQMPEYTDWDPLLYGTWYQPRQINLAYGLLTWARMKSWEENPFEAGKATLHIVDFGAGSLAVQLAAAVAVADAFEHVASIRRIRIDSIDTSQSMMRFGERIWTWFKVFVEAMDPNGALDQVLRLIVYETHETICSIAPVVDATCYVTAINAVYDRNRQEVKADLSSLVKKLRPRCVLTSTVAWKGNLLSEVSPLAGNTEYSEWATMKNDPIDMPIHLAGNVKYMSEWRRQRLRDLEETGTLMTVRDIDHRFIRSMLSNNVTWNYPAPAVLAYTKRSMEDDLPW